MAATAASFVVLQDRETERYRPTDDREGECTASTAIATTPVNAIETTLLFFTNSPPALRRTGIAYQNSSVLNTKYTQLPHRTPRIIFSTHGLITASTTPIAMATAPMIPK